MHRTLLVLLLVLIAAVDARDIVTLTGQIYRDVTITRVEKTGIRIVHSSGVGFLDFMILPSELRKELGYTEAAYAEARAEQARLEEEAGRRAAELARLQMEAMRERERQRTIALETEAEKRRTAIAARNYTVGRGYAERDYSGARFPESKTAQPESSSTTSNSSTPASSYTPSSGGQCAARTKKGYRCSRRASAGSSTCWQH